MIFGERRSFFERLTGSANTEADFPEEESIYHPPQQPRAAAPETYPAAETRTAAAKKSDWLQTDDEGQLTVDMFQTPEHIIIQSTVAGVDRDNLDVEITRDMVTIRGKRQAAQRVQKEDYFYQELYWGAFSRSVLLPQEIDADSAEATIKHGLLTIKLPKLDKNRTQKLRIKSE